MGLSFKPCALRTSWQGLSRLSMLQFPEPGRPRLVVIVAEGPPSSTPLTAISPARRGWSAFADHDGIGRFLTYFKAYGAFARHDGETVPSFAPCPDPGAVRCNHDERARAKSGAHTQ